MITKRSLKRYIDRQVERRIRCFFDGPDDYRNDIVRIKKMSNSLDDDIPNVTYLRKVIGFAEKPSYKEGLKSKSEEMLNIFNIARNTLSWVDDYSSNSNRNKSLLRKIMETALSVIKRS